MIVFLDTSTILAASWSAKGLSRLLIGCGAEYLVTSDTTDFAHVLGSVVYGVKVRTPKSFLLETGVVEEKEGV